MPPECLERIVSHAAKDHRVLSTLMQVNSTLFRMATPYLYREPFRFIFGDEFQLDWDTESWSRHLREIRHAKLLLLYLACTDTVQAQLLRGKERIPARLEKLLTALILPRDHLATTSATNAHGFHTVNYLDYVEHLDLDRFLTSSIQTLFSSPFANSGDKHSVWEQAQIGSLNPGVVHFGHQDQADNGLGGGGNGLNEITGDDMALQVEDPQGVHFADAADTINGIVNVYGVPMEAVPADFHSQYYLLAQNPDESSAIDILGIVQELRGQLEVLDLSRWSWGVVSQQALDLVPTKHLSTLKFHPRTRIQSLDGPLFLRKCSKLRTLDIHAFDAALLHQDSICSSTAAPSLDSAFLSELSLTGSVPNVLPAIRDAIQHQGKSLESIELSASLDGFLSEQEIVRLMDWSTSLSGFTAPHLTTLRLHGHLALMFDVPSLLELCPTLRQFALTIKSYTSSSFVNSDLAHVLRRFMAPLDQEQMRAQVVPKFRLNALELEGPWILTDRDMDQIAHQISGLTHLNLVDCRIHSKTCTDENQDDDQSGHTFMSRCNPVVRLVERAQDTLRVLQIHRRCLEAATSTLIMGSELFTSTNAVYVLVAGD
ncbi:hypothetical protein BGZ68_007591 [Mortierella alpina]|nr:hypothetical protein BGZ68_007591 [Mortierella alpina]